ncbi:rhodanese-like domain-containing protein [Pseudomonas sp. HR96]|uniref:phosphotransferase n=1 Tax=Pseudomonas sp. HR96 TaxID=1027966 RepID=UPI002A759F38|nr:phosphotransferase [Pseudomonas sp. HR96]WPO97555.1 rhodanese-like domain-containing protein [Pseudomonas sp. HR96]
MSQTLHTHGMAGETVAADWPMLTCDDVNGLLVFFSHLGKLQRIDWHSPRPFSSAALISTDRGEWFVKRHHREVRLPAWLEEEHAFIAHLRQAGLGVPEVQTSDDGRTALALGDWTYEIHARAPGQDLYRDAQSWSPFQTRAHAHAAGRSLAQLHNAAEGFQAPLRQARTLTSRWHLFAHRDPARALERYLHEHPAVAAYLGERDWHAELQRHVLPAVDALRPTLANQAPLWTHNDWHASNLLWSANGEVESVLDFGLCDRTFALYDLATALERNAVPWLQLDSEGHARADLDIVDALLEGYHQVRPLSAQSIEALTAWLPVVHAEFALSEMVYFAQVLGNRESTDLAWKGYLLGHAQWFAGAEGQRLLAHIRDHGSVVAAHVARKEASPVTEAAPDSLVSVNWLAEHLHDPRLVILDATVLLPSPRFDGDYRAESGYQGWLDEHIPGSRHADLTCALHDTNARYSFAMPALEPFAAQLQRLGIDDHSRIVIHDRNDGFWAARLWWMLRSVGIAASLLDGGLSAWRAAGQPIHSGPGPQQQPSQSGPTLRHQPGHWVDQQQVLAVSQGQAQGQLVCALGQGVFDGSAATRYHRRGHIPRSLNRPARQLFDEQGRYLPRAQLQQALGSTLLEGDQPVLLYCGGGISAAASAFALTLLGRANVMIYDGSLQQWSANTALPMTTGPTPA